MAKQHGARQQKRLAKQKAKQKQRSRLLARQTSENPAIRFQGAEDWPVVDALEPAELWDVGMGSVLMSRRTPSGQVAAVIFLIDAYCLGVKDVTWRVVHPAEYAPFKADFLSHGEFKAVSPERISKIVHCAADYAQSFGIAPHPDFRRGRLILTGVDPSLCPDELEFGKDGKPLFISGPFDSPERVRQIGRLMAQHGGHSTLIMHGDFGGADEDDADDDDEAIDVESSAADDSFDDDEPQTGLPEIPKFRP